MPTRVSLCSPMVCSCVPYCGSGNTLPDKSLVRRWRSLTVFDGPSPCQIAPSSRPHQTAAGGFGYRRMCSSTTSPRNSEPSDGIICPPLESFEVSVCGPKPASPRAGVPQDQSTEASEGYGCGRFGVRGRLRVIEWESTRNLRVPPSAVHVVGACRPLRAHGEVRAHIAPG